MKAAYDKTNQLHFEPAEVEDDEEVRRDNEDWRYGYRDGIRDGGVLAAFIVGLIVLIGFVFYVGCK